MPRRRGGGTAVEYIDRFGLLGPQMTLGHGVWLNEADIDRLAETGTCICHNCSSNFRLRSGVAALNVFEANGINTAIGMDEAGINDDRDMLQEMRMVLRAHRVPGMDDDVPTPSQVFRMATSGGAKTTAFGERLGTLEVGRGRRHGADRLAAGQLSVSRRRDAAARCGAAACQDRRRAQRDLRRRGDLRGRPVHQGRPRRARCVRCTTICNKALSDDEVERRRLSKALLPHVKAFYAGYFDPARHEPFYRPSSRI